MDLCETAPAAQPDAAPHMPVQDLGDLLIARTGDRYAAFCRGSHLTVVPEDCESLPLVELTEPATLDRLLDRFASPLPAGTDRRAIASLWSLYYASSLMIGASLAFLELRRILPLSLGEASLLMDRQSGGPRGFLLPHLGHVDETANVFAGLAPAIRDNLDPLFAAIARHTGLGRKTLWNNASAYLSWAAYEAGRHAGETLAAEGRLLTESPTWPDGWKNPLARLIRVELDETGAYAGHRRICCLRYAIPTIGGCGAICPVKEGRCGL
ncbi:ferric iron reductase protein FhuF [Rhizobium sp. RU35A]|uniref:siderophore-iron reductase FhuF n=1 Tax=Rhizobium sp. RU35A TaxID=1907414 RepID=UPI0009563E57|nr:siderophore-iron reductase FhuF [Rhizobium sp. RU35A]SIQ94440.1 ferric iron reductase protein FhuF [Rhizobium sp. RU35A]